MARSVRTRRGGGGAEMGSTEAAAAATAATAEDSGYEKCREERIRENLERMKKLGILHLSLDLKSQISSANPNSRRRKAAAFPASTAPPPSPLNLRARRSSRLQNADPVSYAEVPTKNEENLGKRNRRPLIVEGEREEIYTDEHAALLGDCDTSWTLFVDGCGANGKRIYDQIAGKTCHQCRQKTLGHHTRCSTCDLVQGQFCGDCLYMRYGENVLEVEKNLNWICPVCRGICNCSICRAKKGWAPTGALYRKVLNLGFKSVAHYLIQTRRSPTDSEGELSLNAVPPLSNAEDSCPIISLDSKNEFKVLSADENMDGLRAKLVSVADRVVRLDLEEEPLLVESVLDSGSLEKNSNLCSPENAAAGTISRNKGRKTREPAAAAEKQEDSIASRLRKRVRVP